MIRKIIILFFLLKAAQYSMAQNPEPLLRQSTRFSQLIPGDTGSWFQESRNFYVYNSKRLPTYRNYQYYDQQNETWNLLTEYNYGYNDSGNRISDHIKRNNDEGALIREMQIQREYKSDHEVARASHYQNLETSYWEKRWYAWEYDQNDSLTYYSLKYKDSDFTEKIFEDIIYYDENGCKIIEVDTEENIYYGSSTLTKDSVVTDFDDKCRILERNFYQIGLFKPNYNHYYQIRVERTINSSGLISSETYFENSAYTFGYKPYLSVDYEYDLNGRKITEVRKDLETGRENREFIGYNEHDRIVYEHHQRKNNQASEWTNRYEYQAEYIFDSLLLKESFLYNWNPGVSQYSSTFSRTNKYDENLFLIKKTEVQTGTNPANQEEFYATIEYIFDNRCDGQVLSWYVNETDNVNVSEHYFGEKTVNEYYDKAPCDLTTNNENDFSIFPNPSRGDINIFGEYAFGESDISVLNQQGKVVYHSNQFLNNYFSIDLYGLPSGIYILQISNNNIRTSEKFLLVN